MLKQFKIDYFLKGKRRRSHTSWLRITKYVHLFIFALSLLSKNFYNLKVKAASLREHARKMELFLLAHRRT
jgi:hypothetical protein